MNEHVYELLALEALGGLEPAEQERVDAHLAQCDACSAAADEERQFVAALAGATPSQEPDPRLRARILERARASQARQTRAAGQPANWLALPRWILAGLSLALAVLAGWNVYLTRQVSGLEGQVRSSTSAVALMGAPGTEALNLVGGDNAVATGQAFVSATMEDVVLVVQNLAPLPAGQAYQTWIVTDDGATNAGLLEVNSGGWGMKWLEAPMVAKGWVCISVEPAGGSAEPSDVILWSPRP